ncbi:MAG TPA: FmdE family protein [Anaerolineae bacterium]|nr:FmdE family protein [Anaerolineae bacterium]
MTSLVELLQASAALHANRLCPKQVLGVRMGLRAARELDLMLPQTDKRLLTLVETDGCFADGVSVATGCRIGRRTLRIVDFGKIAAAFVDTHIGRAVRIAPRLEARDEARRYAPEARSLWEAQLLGYQRIPDEALLSVQAIALAPPIEQLLSRPGMKALCEACGEEIINERQVIRDGAVLCRSCAGEAYYCGVERTRTCPEAASMLERS